MKAFGHQPELEDRFIELVEQSWSQFDEIERTGWIDDVFVGAVITAHLDAGMYLLTSTSDGSSHYLLFSNQNRDRNVVRVDHRRGEDFLYAKTVGHLTSVTLGVGRAYPEVGKVLRAARSEFQSNMAGEGRVAGIPDPGVMRVDSASGIATCETTLLLDLADFVNLRTLEVDREKLWLSFQATYQALERYLSGIMS